MIMRKETLVFLTSLAIIFIIGYVNITMTAKEEAETKNTIKLEEQQPKETQEGKTDGSKTDLAADEKGTDGKGIIESKTEVDSEESDTVILGDITDITDIESVEASAKPSGEESADTAKAEIKDMLNISFANFKLNKEKGNLDIIDKIEQSISNSLISAETKEQFEKLLVNKNAYIETEQNIELMLQSKGYNETIAVVDENMVKVISNDEIDQADATKILDVIVSETNYEPSQIKIVKFDNIDL